MCRCPPPFLPSMDKDGITIIKPCRNNKEIYQLKLDYFFPLAPSLTGSMTIFKAPPTASNLQYKGFPVDNPNCWQSHFGIVVRKLTESDVAFEVQLR